MDEQQVKDLIRQEMSSSFDKKIGDTPTDALQLANKKYVDSKVGSSTYGGVVNANGSAGYLPSGWTSSLSGSTYTVTHNLATSSYSVVVMINNDTALCGINLTQNVNTFTVSFNKNAGGSETTKVWNFSLSKI